MPAAPPNDLLAIARPLLWLASMAFVLGFAGYLMFGRPTVAAVQDRPQPIAVSGPMSADWNVPKAT
jgi:hypothetical protein